MSESLWNAGEAYLKTQILADMGAAGDYTTLVLDSTYIWGKWGVEELEKLTLPVCIITSYRGLANQAGHSGSSRIQTNDQYSVIVSFVCGGTREAATINAKTLLWRGLKLFRTLRFAGISADDGSKLDRVIHGDAMFRYGVDIWPKPSSTADSVYGLSYIDFDLRGTTV